MKSLAIRTVLPSVSVVSNPALLFILYWKGALTVMSMSYWIEWTGLF